MFAGSSVIVEGGLAVSRPGARMPFPPACSSIAAALLACGLLASPWLSPSVRAEGLRAVVVTIDGIRESEFLAWGERLADWACSYGAYVPDVVNETRGITDPNHAILWGSGDPGQCLNMEGHPAEPMHFELLRKERGLSECVVAFATGKEHLVATNAFSAHPEYGRLYRAHTCLVRSPAPSCMGVGALYEGPDSLIVRAALDHLQNHNVVWMGVNLSEYDFLAHAVGLTCCENDTVCYWARLEEVYRTAEGLVVDEIWPFLESHPLYAGRTLLVVATDHGRHLDDVRTGFVDHGHGWLPDHSGCQLNCAGCREIWAVFVGPGIRAGTVAFGTYMLEDVAATVRHLMGFQNPFERGFPIEEILEDLSTGLEGPRRAEGARPEAGGPNPFRGSTRVSFRLPGPFPVEARVHDLAGREVLRVDLGRLDAGPNEFVWDGRDARGDRAAPGVYFCVFRSDGGTERKKVVLLR